jgi:cadmium resistance protein CadD (predicted permease)
VRTIPGVVVLAALAFVGTMIDNYVAYAAQLVASDPARHRRVAYSQAVGVATLVAFAGILGTLLAPIPLRWVGVLALAPFAYAVHGWRHRRPKREVPRRGALATFVITLALGGDNLAVWTPLLRANGAGRAVVSVATFAVLDVLFLASAARLARHPRVLSWGQQHAPTVMPFVYLCLSVLILVECHTI